MRVGSIVFATEQGLGILAKSFWDHGILTDVIMLRHGRRAEHPEWYPGQPTCADTRRLEQAGRELVDKVDVLLAFETPFAWDLFEYARSKGKKTVLCPMYECEPKKLPAMPDLFVCPSLLDLQYYPNMADMTDEPDKPTSVFLPVPVDVPWRKRERAEVFVHNAGHGGLKGRNGTQELLEAWRHVESPARLILRTQSDMPCPDAVWHGEVSKQIDFRPGTCLYADLYTEGDVFVFPEKNNGLSLPLQEARAAGMLVMCGDRFPMNAWLPNRMRLPFTEAKHVKTEGSVATMEWQYANPLIPVKEYRTSCISARLNDYQEAIFDPKDIAAKIDEWYGRDISAYSEQGREWAASMSWDVLGPKYREVLAG